MLWDKGVGEFVEASAMLKKQGIKARFLLVGDSDPDNPSSIPNEQLEAWHRSGIVEWLGHVTNVSELFGGVHMVCLPSYREGYPKVLIEAAASGRPIVTTDVPGCREVIKNGENGLLVPVKNAEALADALRQLIENPSLRKEMGRRGREIAEKEFSLDKVISETLDIYENMLPAECSTELCKRPHQA